MYEEFSYYDLMSEYMTKEDIGIFIKSLEDDTYFKGAVFDNEKINFSTLKDCFNDIFLNENSDIFINFNSDNLLSKSPLHYAGAYYIVDPSTLQVCLPLIKDVKKSGIVYDLCAAPGGKSITLALHRKDLLIIANEINYKRAITLKSNVERLGLTNVIVTNNSIDDFINNKELLNSADAIILDVPCSGIGMARKKKKMEQDYSDEKAENLVPLQIDLLSKATKLIKENGYIMYSTCSFNTLEDENVVSSVIKNYPLKQIQLNISNSFSSKENLGYHLVPPFFKGEGHYLCYLKLDNDKSNSLTPVKFSTAKINNIQIPIFSYKNNDYIIERAYKEFERLNILSYGITLNNTFPNEKQPYNLNITHINKFKNLFENIDLDIEHAHKYLIGYEIKTDNTGKGLVTVSYNNCKIGFANLVQGKLKNLYPKGLRKKDN